MSLSPAPVAERVGPGRPGDVLDWLARRERAIWVLVVLALVADIALTSYGLANGYVERNPVAHTAIQEAGLLALVVIKLGAVGVGLVGRLALPERFVVIVPIALAVPWATAASINAALLLAA